LRKWNALAADPKEATPGLGVWRRGDRLEQVQVGLAWRDGQFRVWDVQTDRTWEVPDGQANNTVVPGPGADRVFTVSFRDDVPRGPAQEGKWPSAQAPGPVRDRPFPSQEQVYYLPQALGLCSTQAGRPADLAAVILRVPEERKVQLHLLALGQQLRTVREITLPLPDAPKLSWTPLLATVPGGQYLAVAGHPDHSIALYSIPQLLHGPALAAAGGPPAAPAPQVLRSAGTV